MPASNSPGRGRALEAEEAEVPGAAGEFFVQVVVDKAAGAVLQYKKIESQTVEEE